MLHNFVKKRLKSVSEPPQESNESEAALDSVNSRTLHQAQKAEDLTSRSRITRTQLHVKCSDSLCDDVDEVWSHAHRGSRERRDGRIDRNPAKFARRLVYVGRVAPPAESID